MNRRAFAYGIAAAVFALDRGSKRMVETGFGVWDTKVVIPGFFNIIRSENPGVAFGILADSASPLRTTGLVAMTIAAVAVLGWMLWKAQDKTTSISLALITGGALGNLYDRIRVGAATDFLDFYSGHYHWYTFNLADTAICIGAGLMILSMLSSHKTGETS